MAVDEFSYSYEHQRRSKCQRKKRHDTMDQAVAHINSLYRDHGLADGEPLLSPYRCDHCQGIHVGHNY